MATREETPWVELVTGAVRGLGRGIALRLVADALDAPSRPRGRQRSSQERCGEDRVGGQESATTVADVSDQDAVQTMVEGVAGFVSYLTSTDPSHMTGQSVMSDGGGQFS